MRVLLLLAVILLIAALVWSGLWQAASLDGLRGELATLRALREAMPVRAAGGFVLLSIACAALALPVNVLLAVAAGAVFGLIEGVVLMSCAASLGSTLAMLGSRFLFRHLVRRRFAGRLNAAEAALARDGAVYLLSLRLLPGVPYTVVNLLFGLLAFPAWKFCCVSYVGMLPAIMVFVNAGTQLGNVGSIADILSGRVLVSLLLLAAVPLAARRLLAARR